MKLGSKLAFAIFILVAVVHALRLLFDVSIVVGGVVVPDWVSIGGVLVPAWVATLLWRERSIKRQ